MTACLTGNDTTIISSGATNVIFNDFATGIVVEIDFPEDLVKVTRGKNGNTVYALNNSGFQSQVKLRILLGGPNDQFLNQQLALQKSNFAAFILLGGIYVKNTGDGKGNVNPVTYVMSGGILRKIPKAQTVAEGNTDQSLAEWELIYANNDRGIG